MSPPISSWILDTRLLWPEATQTAQLPTVASSTLALLSPSEQSSALKYYHVRDAKLSIGSALLKRLAIAQHCHVPWHAATASRDPQRKNGKPLFGGVALNVSHQAGLVVLLAVRCGPGDEHGEAVDVGVDVVSTAERRARDREMVRQEGWAAFVDVHAEVFSPREVSRLKMLIPSAGEEEDLVDARLREFYALWCLREAYVKMTGEALLAPWLGQLEFRRFRAPVGSGGADGALREDDLEIWFGEERVQGVRMDLRAVGEEQDGYMVCGAVRRGRDGKEVDIEGLDLGGWRWVTLEEILGFAEGG